MPEPLRAAPVGRVITHLAETGSTNSLALGCRMDGAVFVADRQTAGRGRRGRVWESRPGLGLWCSVALAGGPEGLNFAAPLAVMAALQEQVPVVLKWPNDILIDGKKVCGVLVEHRAGWSAVGIGLNVGHALDDFSPALRETATSLALATGRPWSRYAVLRPVLAALAARVATLRSGGLATLRAAWEASLNVVGRPVARAGVTGTVIGLTDAGALRVRTAAGIEVVMHSDPDDETEGSACSW